MPLPRGDLDASGDCGGGKFLVLYGDMFFSEACLLLLGGVDSGSNGRGSALRLGLP